MESKDEAVNIRLTQHLLRRVLTPPYRFELDAHPAVEMTLFNQPQSHRLLVSLLNMQPQMPPVTVGATVRVQLPSGRAPGKVLRVPDSKPIPCQKKGPYLEFKTEPFDVFFMALVEYA
jgi:hypothetical protein